MRTREEEYLRRMRALGYEPSLAGMDDGDIEWELAKMEGGDRRRAAEWRQPVYRPVDPGLKARILRMFGQPYDESAIPTGQEFYLNGWDNGEDEEEWPRMRPEPRVSAPPGGWKMKPDLQGITYDPETRTITTNENGGFEIKGSKVPGQSPLWKSIGDIFSPSRGDAYRPLSYTAGVNDGETGLQEGIGTDGKYVFEPKLQSKYQEPKPPDTKLQDNFQSLHKSSHEAGALSPYGLQRPIASGTEAGYISDSGLDISAPVSTPVLAAAGGKVIYAEAGHTKWQRHDPATGEPIDTPYSVLIELDTPITYKDGRQAKYIWYTHMSKLAVEKADGDGQIIRIEPGQVIGYSGTANDSPHLHFGVLINRAQDEGDYFTPAEVREMLGIKERDKW
ncbi:M23 family metallopeptidase [Anaeroselena agilis]|uniref:M23 family metallopeptidase n=1 Tax=Anaeroselena agilis TaxID=3063788 RepID=A0ABU3NVA3_9FIRM|nr:M23 family metallopeptidase [Selenomonadales bacterium 4137-cl]